MRVASFLCKQLLYACDVVGLFAVEDHNCQQSFCAAGVDTLDVVRGTLCH
jgi:hypothetical protein